mgnify:CR=1 FL=1
MGLKKALGILVFSTQAVIGYDYYIQTRDAGLRWGELSAADYSTILQDRYARARAAKAAARLAAPPAGEGETIWAAAASYGKRLFSGGEQVAEAQGGEEAEPGPESVRVNKGLGAGNGGTCVRRGTALECN